MHHTVNSPELPAGPPNTNGKVQPATGQDSIESTTGQAPFEFDDTLLGGSYGWYRNETDGTSRRIGAFDILIHSKIIRYNPETLKWDSTLYECQVSWLTPETRKLTQSELFVLEPEDLLSKKAFQIQIFKHSYQSARFKSDDEILFFMSFLCNRWQPQTVYEFNYYGFIEHHGYTFYLTRNALITIPEDHLREPQYMIAPDRDSGLFPMVAADTTFYVKPGRIEPAPLLDLPSPTDGFYSDEEHHLFTGKELQYFIDTVRDKFGELIAGQQPEKKAEGYLIFSYMLSFLFFDEIENMAALITVDMFVARPSDVQFAEFFNQSLSEKETGTISKEDLREMQHVLKDSRLAPEIFRYGVQFLANSAEREVHQTPLQQFLASIEIMNDNGVLPKRYYGWNTKDGLVMYWSGIWDAYTNYNKGREYISQDIIREEIEALDLHGKAKTNYYSYEDPVKGTVKESRHGYHIPRKHLTPTWLRAFGKREEANIMMEEQGRQTATEYQTSPGGSSPPF